MLKALLKATAETALCPLWRSPPLSSQEHPTSPMHTWTLSMMTTFLNPKSSQPWIICVCPCLWAIWKALLYPPLFLRHEYGTRSFYCLEPWEGRRGAGGGGVAEVAQLFPLAEFECSLIVELCPLRAHVVKSLDSKMVEPLGCGA